MFLELPHLLDANPSFLLNLVSFSLFFFHKTIHVYVTSGSSSIKIGQVPTIVDSFFDF